MNMRDFWWNLAFMYESKFNALSKQGLKREEVFSMNKYVDDCNCESLLCCTKCAEDFIQGTYRTNFEQAEPHKFLDMKKSFTREKGDRKPRLVLRPCLKNERRKKGIEDPEKNPTDATAPWWAPYPPQVLAGVFYGFVLRFRQILPRMADRKPYIGRVTSEYILQGYRLRDVRTAWAKLPWSLERQEMLRRLGDLKKKRLPTERRNLLVVQDLKLFQKDLDRYGASLFRGGPAADRRRAQRGIRRLRKLSAKIEERVLGEKMTEQKPQAWDWSSGQAQQPRQGQGQSGGARGYFDRHGNWRIPGQPGQGKRRFQKGQGPGYQRAQQQPPPP